MRSSTRIPPIQTSQAVETLIRGNVSSLVGDLGASLDAVFAPESQALSDPERHRPEELEFLVRMETFLQEELSNSRDEHFVELSMKLADPGESGNAKIQRKFAVVFGDADSEQPRIPNLVELETAIRTYRRVVLLGAPGSGKTTVLQQLALLLIGAYREGRSGLLPLYFPLIKYFLASNDGEALPVLRLLPRHVEDLVGVNHFVARNFG